jgi:hypothetical protein
VVQKLVDLRVLGRDGDGVEESLGCWHRVGH